METFPRRWTKSEGKEVIPKFGTVLLLVASNVFMTVAWYGHLKKLGASPWYVAAISSWLIAFFEYMLQVPANRMGYSSGITLPQLKIIQEAVALSVFIPFSVLFMGQRIGWNYIAASACIALAVFFVFAIKE